MNINEIKELWVQNKENILFDEEKKKNTLDIWHGYRDKINDGSFGLDDFTNHTNQSSYLMNFLENESNIFGSAKPGTANAFGIKLNEDNTYFIKDENKKATKENANELFEEKIKPWLKNLIKLEDLDKIIDKVENEKNELINANQVLRKIVVLEHPKTFLAIYQDTAINDFYRLIVGNNQKISNLKKNKEIVQKLIIDGFLDTSDLENELLRMSLFLWKFIEQNNYFSIIIKDLKGALLKDESILKDFSFGNTGKNWVWVIDHKHIIGNLIAHYELVLKKNNLSWHIHFEGTAEQKEIFYGLTENLPLEYETFKWQEAKSIREKKGIDLYSDNVVELIKNRLLNLENNLGDKVRELIKDKSLTELPDEEVTKNKYSGPLNQILYGPPGTGKTYNTINKALEIIGVDESTLTEIENDEINPKLQEAINKLRGKINVNENKLLTEKESNKVYRTSIKELFDYYVKKGQIVFTTFHQSMSYEDFVEGIKPQKPKNDGDPISYMVEDGIFKKICKEASKKTKIIQKIDEDENELTPEMFKEYYSSFVEKLPSQNENSSEYKLKTTKSNIFELYKNSANSIVVKAGDKKTPMSLCLNELTKVKFEEMSPFYSSYENIVIDKILENIKTEEKRIDNSNKPYVLIIDEINRGNVSSIFGELITLIEEDKRLDNDESLEITLPYSKVKFGIPKNLYIIGTMNTADRSVEALDTALRRRFSFDEMPPDYSLLENIKVENFDLKELLETINKRIEVLLDRDHLIGHSYFLNLKNITDLKEAFSKQIIPLLQEYFFGDYGKIALVLGTGFCAVKDDPQKNKNVFAKVEGYDTDAFADKVIYKINNPLESNNENFRISLNMLLKKTVPQPEENNNDQFE